MRARLLQILVEVPFLLLFRSEDLQKLQHGFGAKRIVMLLKCFKFHALSFFSFFTTVAWGGPTRSPKEDAAASNWDAKLVLSALFAWTRVFAFKVVPTVFTWEPWQQKSYKQQLQWWKHIYLQDTGLFQILEYLVQATPSVIRVLASKWIRLNVKKFSGDHAHWYSILSRQSCGWLLPTWPQHQTLCSMFTFMQSKELEVRACYHFLLQPFTLFIRRVDLLQLIKRELLPVHFGFLASHLRVFRFNVKVFHVFVEKESF